MYAPLSAAAAPPTWGRGFRHRSVPGGRAASLRLVQGGGLGALQAPVMPAYQMSGFHGAPDTLNLMREHAWGEHGEHSVLVRLVLEEITRGLFPKDYLGEILAVRNFVLGRLRYLNDPLHIEWIRTPQTLVEEIIKHGVAQADCDEMAQLIGTFGLLLGREAEFVVVGFGEPGDYSHVFARIKEPKTGQWIVCDPVAGSDERTMLERVTTYEVWSLDEVAAPVSGWPMAGAPWAYPEAA